ncbi:HD-GYP domain-containing protein [Roseateles toxinivorans]|uniref:Putative nucleotidyltransferase with HDIG domain n=1 Tax=Roseateles toxinivorans TaxID=270368 RepID=A0A4R6QM19_9BURK|nr:HD-GYP domain-containing protein [Roseateles toxinivorans]TDP63265.1 putative nucleotidyltransferase with HDIG domain [Roseateles toxinivorans]
MLKKIESRQLQLGMFIQSFEGSWLSHPFWKTKFLLRDPADLEAIRKSGVATCWIDVAKGLDVGAKPAAAAPVAAAQASEPAPETPVATATTSKPKPPAAAEPKASMGSELQRAAGVINRSRQQVVALFGEARLGRSVNSEQCMTLVEGIADSVSRNPSALISLARLKTKDDYTYMHSVAVCALMVSLARHLNLGEEQVREAGFAGLLHDIGKMAMPAEVLNKPGALTDAEYKVMQLHPERGHQMLMSGSQVLPGALDVCLHHHEKMDGTGYPHKLPGDQISLLARMGAVCDVYDAITSTRPYKSAWDPAGSIQRMAQWKGHFDPAVFQAFVKSVGIYPVGSLVRLQSGRLAVVAEQHPTSLVTPRLKVFFSTKSQMPIPLETLDLAQPGCNDRILGRESPSQWGFQNLDELWQ